MKKILFILLPIYYSCSAYADDKERLIISINSSTKSNVQFCDNYMFIKRFDLTIKNPSAADVPLDGLCLTSYSPQGDAFKVDTIHENLSVNVIKAGQEITGFAFFSWDNANIYDANSVSFSNKCGLTSSTPITPSSAGKLQWGPTEPNNDNKTFCMVPSQPGCAAMM